MGNLTSVTGSVGTGNATGPGTQLVATNLNQIFDTLQQSDVQPATNNANFTSPGVVVNFTRTDGSGVSYNPGGLGSIIALGTAATSNRILNFSSGIIPAGQYNLTIFIPGQGYKQVLVNVT